MSRAMRLPLAAALALAAAVLALVPAAANARTARDVVVFFRTPSGNIGCDYSVFSPQPATLRCDIRSRLRHPKPARPRGCRLDWGDSLSLTRTGRPVLTCHGDTAIIPHSHVVAYGTTWKRGGFACASQTTGLTCRNLAGHGFFLSRQSWRTF